VQGKLGNRTPEKNLHTGRPKKKNQLVRHKKKKKWGRSGGRRGGEEIHATQKGFPKRGGKTLPGHGKGEHVIELPVTRKRVKKSQTAKETPERERPQRNLVWFTKREKKNRPFLPTN